MKVNKPDNELGMRLAKAMSQRGICSRREADDYILNGWVKVNGIVIRQKGYKVVDYDEISLSEKALQDLRSKITIVLNKPVGYVSGQPEKNYKAAIDLITTTNHWKGDKSGIRFQPKHLAGLAVAGRLDIDSKGLLILTSDGIVAKKIIGSENKIEKEYLVRVSGELSEKGLALLNNGLSLDGEKLKPAKVSWQNKDQLLFLLRQGKKRQIRRMCEMVGLKVIGLKRVRVGNVLLANLPEGQWRYLSDSETI